MRSRNYFIPMLLLICVAGRCVPALGAASAAILFAPFPAEPSHADPRELRAWLRERGMEAELLSPAQLADETLLTPERHDVLILPYGSCFPAAAADAFRTYLEKGGAFVNLGGYAFDTLLNETPGGWEPVSGDETPVQLSGRAGRPGDTVQFEPGQLVVFDPTFEFRRTVSVGPGEPVFPNASDWRVTATVEGFPAVALTGSNSPVFPETRARWWPVLRARDRYGENRGSVFSLMMHFGGPYEGSAWAFSGVTNINLFSRQYPAAMDALRDTILAMRARVFLSFLEAERGEGGGLSARCRAENRGASERTASLRLTAGGFSAERSVRLAAGESFEWIHPIEQEAPAGGYLPVTARLTVDGLFQDEMRTGWAGERQTSEDLRSLTFEDNYFHLNGHPRIVFGTNQTGMMWFSPDENPATWERDFSLMRDCGLRMLRVLHFSPFAKNGFEGSGAHGSHDLIVPPPRKLVDKTDQMVRMAARHGLALMLVLHDWLPVELEEDRLRRQREWNAFWAGRYRDRPNVLFDIQNEPWLRLDGRGEETLEPWNRFLRERYGSIERLREAWGGYSPAEPLGEIPCEPGPDEWDNPRVYEYNLFRARIVRRWIEANAAGIGEGYPQALDTVGFIQMEYAADKWLTPDALDFVNTHYHGPYANFSPIAKMAGRRWRGQGLGVGEFGGWDAHEARKYGRFSSEIESSKNHFLAVTHQTFGMGGSFALNWDWKDMDGCVFPWGLLYSNGGVPKDWLYVYRNTALFLGSFEPRYEDPGVYLVLPDNHRLGGRGRDVAQALIRSVRWLFAARTNFNVIHERGLDELPAAAHTLIWPAPYCPDDSVFNRLVDFAKEGGNVYLSGGVSFDPMRRPSRANRMAELGLPAIEPRKPFESVTNIQSATGFIVSRPGRGLVYFLPAPAELSPAGPGWNPYAEFLDAAGEIRFAAEPDDPELHVFFVPTADGGSVYTVFRNATGAQDRLYTINVPQGRFSLGLGRFNTGLAAVNANGGLIAIEGSGALSWNGETVADSGGHVMLRSGDGLPIPRSRSLLIFPSGPGSLEIVRHGIAEPMLLIGELRDGEWRELERMEPAFEGGSIRIELDETQATKLAVLAERGHGDESVNQLRRWAGFSDPPMEP